ncbi:hypothetical protein ABVK25_008800 [Lepraria finkii]|uniref:Uncharacterized protein n=1 Tax=Lepraria finkii TaxID=1340010 RepID=A0ABR4AZ16_9LECA
MPMRIRVPGYDRSIARHEPHLEDHLQDIQNDVRDSFWLCARVYCLQLGWNALSYMEVAPTWFPDLKIFASQKLVKRHFERQLPLLAPQNLGDIHRFLPSIWHYDQPPPHESVEHPSPSNSNCILAARMALGVGLETILCGW